MDESSEEQLVLALLLRFALNPLCPGALSFCHFLPLVTLMPCSLPCTIRIGSTCSPPVTSFLSCDGPLSNTRDKLISLFLTKFV